jgi:two-component system response regulator DegU
MLTLKSISSSGISVIVADPNDIFLEGLKAVTNRIPSVSIQCCAKNADELLMLLKNVLCDILITDSVFLGAHFENIQKFKHMNPMIKVIGCSNTADVGSVSHAMNLGCDGFLLKDTNYTEIQEAIKCVMTNETFLNKKLRDVLTRYKFDLERDSISLSNFLNDKKLKEVLFLICHGYTSKEIAPHLDVAKKTVDKYRLEIMKATGVKNLSSLILYALKNQVHQDYDLLYKYRVFTNLAIF